MIKKIDLIGLVTDGFLRIFTEAIDGLFQVRLSWLRDNDCLAGSSNRRKASVKKRRNKAPGFIRLDPKIHLQLLTLILY